MPTRPAHHHPPPWWLRGGTEECPHCGLRHHFEAERRCAGCDVPSCGHCLTDEEQLCPACAKEARG